MHTATYSFIQAGQTRLHVASAGPVDGEVVILLHGFPDASFGWEKQITFLAEAGYRVIAPDQRGYGLSDRPKRKAAYQMQHMVADVLALANALGIERFNLVGHDYGAIVSWLFAAKYPERLKHLVIMNVPHPTVMNEYLKRNRPQQRKSWYIFFFQLPILPELMMRADNYNRLASIMSKAWCEADLERYRESWARPGALTGMINWYRNVFHRSPETSITEPISVPTLMIWGKQDLALSWEMAEPSIARCENGRLVFVDDASHWVHQDEPDKVNQLMLEHFRE